MYAVIKTGGKQYRVQAGDMLIVEKLVGEPGAKVAFDQVLMLGDGAGVTVGAPLVDGAVVNATLVETRKGEKIKVFKKIRRQGYRRTGGHRQQETVIRVTSINGAGASETAPPPRRSLPHLDRSTSQALPSAFSSVRRGGERAEKGWKEAATKDAAVVAVAVGSALSAFL